MSSKDCIDFLNARTMNSREAVATYSSFKTYPVEEAVLSSIRNEIEGQPILDLGVGGGRTVAALREISKDYVGLDYSENMVRSCRKRFPGVRFIHADARDMSQFEDNSFALIVFSCEGICMVNHEGRLAILSEVKRLLRPDGIFIFSAYNTDSEAHDQKFKYLSFQSTPNPIRYAVRAGRGIALNIFSLLNRLRFKKFEVRLPEYSIINDVYHYYSTLLYYISIDNQKNQLHEIGFRGDTDVVDDEGFLHKRGSTQKSLWYITRK